MSPSSCQEMIRVTSYQISHTRTRIAAARFIGKVRREILRSLAEEGRERGLTQSDIAREIGVHRSVINRELRGFKDISVGRVAEVAAAMGRIPIFSLDRDIRRPGDNAQNASQTLPGTDTPSTTVMLYSGQAPSVSASSAAKVVYK